jgi:tetratricopeptide (TPR) repeat protein
MERLESLRLLLQHDPQNRLAHYGLAMELANQGDLEGAASEFRNLIAIHPDYAYAYFHCGQALEKLDRSDEARDIYQQGLAAAARSGDGHARSEIQGALDILG